LYYW
jgi:hypothetical protein